MLSPLFLQSDFTFSYHKLKITWQFHHYAPRLSARKTNCSWLASFKTCGIRSQIRHCPAKNHSNPQKQGIFPQKPRDISQKTRHISQKIRDISLKTRDFSQNTRHISRKARDILKPNAVLSIYAEDAAEIPLPKCKTNDILPPRAHAYARIYTRVLCFLLSHLSQCFASICKTLRYLGFEGF